MNQESAPLLVRCAQATRSTSKTSTARLTTTGMCSALNRWAELPGTNFEFATSGAPLVLHRDGQAANSPRGRVGFVPSFQVQAWNSRADRDIQAARRARGS